MISAFSYEQVIEELRNAFINRYEAKPTIKMIGLLFSPPHTRIAKEEIIPRLHYYHHLSGNSLDFFCIGYGGYLPRDEYPDVIELGSTKPDAWHEIPWAYSDLVFIPLCREIAKRTRWNYSGESDLILANAIYHNETEKVSLDFTSALNLDLDLMIKDEPTLSVGRIFENICRYADKFDGVIEALPKAASLLWKRGRHWRTINLEA